MHTEQTATLRSKVYHVPYLCETVSIIMLYFSFSPGHWADNLSFKKRNNFTFLLMVDAELSLSLDNKIINNVALSNKGVKCVLGICCSFFLFFFLWLVLAVLFGWLVGWLADLRNGSLCLELWEARISSGISLYILHSHSTTLTFVHKSERYSSAVTGPTKWNYQMVPVVNPSIIT